jgi:hypothetical protein
MTNKEKLETIIGIFGNFRITDAAVECMDALDEIADKADGKSIHYEDLVGIEMLLDDIGDSSIPVVANYIASRVYFDKDAHRFLEKLTEIDHFDGPLFEFNGDVSDNIGPEMM